MTASAPSTEQTWLRSNDQGSEERSRAMLIIGCDFHTRYQQIAMAREETGELLVERRLDHEGGEAHAFYRSLQEPVRVGMEATGPIHWFQRLLAELMGALLPRAIAASEERIMVGSRWPHRWLVEPESTVRFTSEPLSR